MACILDDGKLTLSGDVGDFGFGDHFSHASVVVALAMIDDEAPLTVYLNSGGGYVDDGAAIHALLSRRSGRTDTVVDGIAASAASLIAMAGETVTMSAGSVMMIHDPAQFTFGSAADHEKTIEQLDAYGRSFARIYAAKSGKTLDECRAIMKATTWLSPDEAVAEGFADKTSDTPSRPVAAFDYRAYAHAPKQLTALASSKKWRIPETARPTASAPANTGPSKEITMTDKERAEAAEAELATLKAQMRTSEAADTSAELETLRAEKKARENGDAIMALDEAKKRQPQARALADAGVPVASAKTILAAAPEAEDDDRDARPLNGAGLRPSAANPKPGEGFSLAAQMRQQFKKEGA